MDSMAEADDALDLELLRALEEGSEEEEADVVRMPYIQCTKNVLYRV